MLTHTVPFLGLPPPTPVLSSVTQPKTHADSLPSPVVILQATPFCRKPILHSLPNYCWNAFAHLPVVTCWSDQATHPLSLSSADSFWGRGVLLSWLWGCVCWGIRCMQMTYRGCFCQWASFPFRYYYFSMNVYQVTIKVPGEEQEAAQVCLWFLHNVWSDARLIVGTQ